VYGRRVSRCYSGPPTHPEAPRLPDLDRHLDRQLRAQERQLIWVRLAVAIIAAAVVLVFRDQLPGLPVLLTVLGVVVVYDAALWPAISRYPAREVGIVATALDLSAVTVAVYAAASSIDAYLFYVPIILSVAFRYGLGASVWASFVCSATYAAVIAIASGEGAVRELLPVRVVYLVGAGLAAGLLARGVLASALENAELHGQLDEEERARERAREREILAGLSRDFGRSLDPDATAHAIVHGAAPLIGDVVALLRIDPGEELAAQLVPAHVESDDVALAEQVRAHFEAHPGRVGQGIAGGAAATATSILAGSESEPPPSFPGDPDGVAALHLTAVLAVPVISRGRVGGVLVAASVGRRAIGEADRRLAEAIVERAGPALDNAALWSDLQRQVARERQAQRIKDDFLSIVSHELRTPLTSIQGYSQLLEGRLRDASGAAKELAHLRVIRSQVARMRRLVDDLLDVSRIDKRGGVSIEPERIDLADEVRAVGERIEREHRDREVRVEVPATLPITADRDRIGQVLTNLADNAVKYSPDGGPVTLRAWRGTEQAHIAVADTGVGIPENQLHLVFDRFFQADAESSKRRFGGLGLGLYISRAIVEAHGGRIWAEANRQAGHGTIFRVQLPIVARSTPTPAPASGEPPEFVLRRGADRDR
jgi:signal transduction histidine kinase